MTTSPHRFQKTLHKSGPSKYGSGPDRVLAPAPRIALSPAELSYYADGWLVDCEIRQHSVSTLTTRRMTIRNLLWLLRLRERACCGTAELREFFTYLLHGHKDAGGRWGNPQQTRPVRPRTVDTYHGHLGTFFAWVIAQGGLDVSPMARITRPVCRADQIQPFTPDQVEDVLAAARRTQGPRRDEAIVMLLLDTGIRASELCGLKQKDLDLTEKRITVLGKGNKRRSIYFGQRVSKSLWTYLRDKEIEGEVPLFPSERARDKGAPLTRYGLYGMIARLAISSGVTGVRCSPHTFRHAQPVDSPVLTPSGWRPLGEIRAGDAVIGADGLSTSVIGVYPQGPQPVVRLTFDDDASAECTLDHLWSVWEPAVRRQPRYPIVPKTLSTREIIESGLNWHFPLVRAVEFEAQEELPVAPYLLGALLGDGHFGQNLIMAGDETKQEVMDRVAGLLPQNHRVSGTPARYLLCGIAPSAKTEADKRKPRPGGNALLGEMRRLGLAGMRSETKFIPKPYLRAGTEDRAEMLRGLMDTDGSATRHSSAEFTTISEQLARDVTELVRSLGGTARTRKTLPYRGAKNPAYRLSIRTPFSPFHLGRKTERYESRPKQPFVRRLVAHEPAGTKECVCIQVASADSLYVTQDYIVTHNTFAVSFLRAGGQVFALKEILGHTDIKQTLKYVALADADLQNQRRFSPADHLTGRNASGQPRVWSKGSETKAQRKPLAPGSALEVGRPTLSHPEKITQSKLSEQEVRQIKARLAVQDGQTKMQRRVEIAAAFGISAAAVKEIDLGYSWRHVE